MGSLDQALATRRRGAVPRLRTNASGEGRSGPAGGALRVAVAGRMLARNGCASGIASHVSWRDADGSCWVAPYGRLDLLEPAAVRRFGLDHWGPDDGGRSGAPSNYGLSYLDFYRARPDVRAVIHVHSANVMAMCTLREEIGFYNDSAVLLVDNQVLVRDSSPTAGSARHLAQALGDRAVLLIENHGVVVVGTSLAQATVLACLVEAMAGLHLRARTLGGQPCAAGRHERLGPGYEAVYVGTTWAENLGALRRSDPTLVDDAVVEDLVGDDLALTQAPPLPTMSKRLFGSRDAASCARPTDVGEVS